MYYKNRQIAGRQLALQMRDKYRYDNCAVVALTDGGVLVGEQIAIELHCVLTMLLTEDIDVPGEGLSFGAVAQNGNFTYNSAFSSGEIEEYTSEFHGYLSEQRREKFQKMNRLVAGEGTIHEDLLRNRVVILVSDGFCGGSEVDVALDFLKPLNTEKIVVASPIASIPAVDRMHIQADDLYILDVKSNYINTNHYYDDNTLPEHEDMVKKISEIVMNWR